MFLSSRSRSKNKDKDIVELEAESKAEEEAADTVDAEQRAAFLIGQLELAEVPQNAHGLGTISVVVEEEEEDLEDEEDDDDVIAEVSPGSAGGGRDGSEPKASPATSSSKAPFTSRKRSRSFTVSRASRRSWSLLRNTFTVKATTATHSSPLQCLVSLLAIEHTFIKRIFRPASKMLILVRCSILFFQLPRLLSLLFPRLCYPHLGRL